MKKLSIKGLFSIAAQEGNSFSSTLSEMLLPRVNAQLHLLEILSKESSSNRMYNNSIESLKALYSDTLEFASNIGQQPVKKRMNNNLFQTSTLTSTRMKKFISNKFEFLDARHSTVIETFADIVKIMEEKNRDEALITTFLENQTSTSLLLQHGFLLSSKKFHQPTGCAQYDCNIFNMCEGVIEHATNLADHNVNGLHRCPMINLKESRNCNMRSSIDCVPSSVRFVLLELVKNAISSTLLQSQSCNYKASVPPIDVILESTDAYVIVYVKDNGEGLRGKTLSDLSKFVHNVKRGEIQSNQQPQASYQPQSAALSGMGAGLSVALVWARKFGGDLELLDRSGHDACSNSSSAENGCKTEDSYSNSNSSGVVAKFLIPRDIDIEEK